MMVYAFSQCSGSRPRQICEFKSSLVYIVSSRAKIHSKILLKFISELKRWLNS